jgi:hypothetical protein
VWRTNKIQGKTMKKTRLIVALATILSPAIFTMLHAETTRELASHNHGEAQLSLVLDGDQIAFTLASPAANLVGFEHAPENEAQQTKINNAKQTLGDLSSFLGLSSAVNCEPVEQSVHWSLDEEHEEHEENETAHSEFEADFLLACKNMAQLKWIDVNLFDLFPAIEKIRVEAILPNFQTASVLTSESRRISVEQ